MRVNDLNVITVSGSSSGVGKTRFVSALLGNLSGWSALKVTVSRRGHCPRNKPCGACNNTVKKFSIITDRKTLSENGKDTRRFKECGAKKVAWLIATPGGLREGLKEAMDEFRGSKGLIIEGTSALKWINPTLAVFITGRRKNAKPSANFAMKKADIILKM